MDRYNVMPPELEDGAPSPVDDLRGMEWDDVNKELEEFMGSDMDDSDMDSTDRGFDTDRDDELKGQKRKYGDDLDECGVCGVYGFGARGFLGVRGMLFGFLMPIAFASS